MIQQPTENILLTLGAAQKQKKIEINKIKKGDCQIVVKI